MKKFGTITVACGPMGSGKSAETLTHIERYERGKRSVVAFKHVLDTRDGPFIKSRNGRQYEATIVANASEMRQELIRMKNKSIGLLVVDEAQFFDSMLIDIVQSMVSYGMDVFLSGLDKDSNGKPFMLMPQLLAIADEVKKLKAVCEKCGHLNASYSHRKDGSTNALAVGGDELYEPRCYGCWVKDQPNDMMEYFYGPYWSSSI